MTIPFTVSAGSLTSLSNEELDTLVDALMSAAGALGDCWDDYTAGLLRTCSPGPDVLALVREIEHALDNETTRVQFERTSRRTLPYKPEVAS
jgi:hypothetical protein